ncbi:MAG: hypothetical protein NTW77_01280 [Bacteroidetes bacterium]|nr:hypothetical protein [Bacteroidota bacterium]
MIFPVKVPYTVGPDIVKYEGPAFNANPDPTYLLEKKKELELHGSHVCATISNDYLHHLNTFCGIDVNTTLPEICVKLEEDVAILKDGHLHTIGFCFPSETLRRSSEIVSALISKQDAMFRRYVWTLTSLPSLSQLPSYVKPTPQSINDLYFRTETQTTVGIGGDICLFFVKVKMHPLQQLWDDYEKRTLIVESIHSMSEAVLAYKNLTHIKSIINL